MRCILKKFLCPEKGDSACDEVDGQMVSPGDGAQGTRSSRSEIGFIIFDFATRLLTRPRQQCALLFPSNDELALRSTHLFS